ncbi:MAG TPA: hypothetical protein VF595_01725 [Tepidisphaeraceae bacterium]|jgi:hypothetical protein
MYFVIIDLQQLYTRLCNSAGNRPVDTEQWLGDNQFIRTHEGWLGSADSMNCLSCSEIVYSERRWLNLHRPHAAHAQLAG